MSEATCGTGFPDIAEFIIGRHSRDPLAHPPSFIPGLQIAIMCYVGAGRIEDAQRVMADCLRMIPDRRSSTMRENNGLRSPELRMKMREAGFGQCTLSLHGTSDCIDSAAKLRQHTVAGSPGTYGFRGGILIRPG
jgi:hypothetical protein